MIKMPTKRYLHIQRKNTSCTQAQYEETPAKLDLAIYLVLYRNIFTYIDIYILTYIYT